MSFWTGVRLPPAPLIFIRRDPPKVGGILVKHADACERSSPINASAPLNGKAGHIDFVSICSVFLFKLQVDGLTRDDRIRCMYDV